MTSDAIFGYDFRSSLHKYNLCYIPCLLNASADVAFCRVAGDGLGATFCGYQSLPTLSSRSRPPGTFWTRIASMLVDGANTGCVLPDPSPERMVKSLHHHSGTGVQAIHIHYQVWSLHYPLSGVESTLLVYTSVESTLYVDASKCAGCNKRCCGSNRSNNLISNNTPTAYSHTNEFKKKEEYITFRKIIIPVRSVRWRQLTFNCYNTWTHAHTESNQSCQTQKLLRKTNFPFPQSFNIFPSPKTSTFISTRSYAQSIPNQ